MKILILNASPKKHGCVTRMLETMRQEAKKQGEAATLINVSDLQVKPCMGCMACRSRGECSMPPDDAQLVLKLMHDCDVLIVGAPTYWGNMPGTLKILFDRMVYGLMTEGERFPKPLLSGRRAIILSTCNTPWPFSVLYRQSRGCVNAIREVLKWSGFKIVKTFERGNVRRNPISEKELKKVRTIMHKL